MTKTEILTLASNAETIGQYEEAGVLWLISENGGFDLTIQNINIAVDADGIDRTELAKYIGELKSKYENQ